MKKKYSPKHLKQTKETKLFDTVKSHKLTAVKFIGSMGFQDKVLHLVCRKQQQISLL